MNSVLATPVEPIRRLGARQQTARECSNLSNAARDSRRSTQKRGGGMRAAQHDVGHSEPLSCVHPREQYRTGRTPRPPSRRSNPALIRSPAADTRRRPWPVCPEEVPQAAVKSPKTGQIGPAAVSGHSPINRASQRGGNTCQKRGPNRSSSHSHAPDQTLRKPGMAESKLITERAYISNLDSSHSLKIG